jgi:hypothetical protein
MGLGASFSMQAWWSLSIFWILEHAQPACVNLRANLSVFKYHKQGNDPSDYEDASEPTMSGEISTANPSIAISDGATESSFSSLWARLLVATFVGSDLPPEQRFSSAVKKGARIWRRIVDSKTLPWYAEEKRRQGAFATLLGTSFTERGMWTSIAIGDSCFFKIDADGIANSFPIEDEKGFGSTPPLICSRNTELRFMRTATGTWMPGDLFFWMTDAAAQWFIYQTKIGLRPWELIASFPDSVTFESWLASTRLDGSMRNDDVTILMLRVNR